MIMGNDMNDEKIVDFGESVQNNPSLRGSLSEAKTTKQSI